MTIKGHMDSFGNDLQNLQLSQQRAGSVMVYLNQKLNFDEERIRTAGYGESMPIATNETEEGRAKNGRIVVIIHPK